MGKILLSSKGQIKTKRKENYGKSNMLSSTQQQQIWICIIKRRLQYINNPTKSTLRLFIYETNATELLQICKK